MSHIFELFSHLQPFMRYIKNHMYRSALVLQIATLSGKKQPWIELSSSSSLSWKFNFEFVLLTCLNDVAVSMAKQCVSQISSESFDANTDKRPIFSAFQG
jgi:hypothetical protein